jgi:membrane protein DedA with SNARE-associated domain
MGLSMPSIESLLSLIAHYGYLLVFLGVLLESMGVPVPGETVLIAAGVLAQRGTLNVVPTMLVAASGAIIGDQLGYFIGRAGGRRFLLRWGRYIGITPERIEGAEAFFARHGGKAVFLARFIPGLRVFGALMAGVSRMAWHTFAIYNALGGIVWSCAAVLGGYAAGSSYQALAHWIGRIGGAVAAAVVLSGLLVVLIRRRRRAGEVEVEELEPDASVTEVRIHEHAGHDTPTEEAT